MTTMAPTGIAGLSGALLAAARSPEIPESADVYGWLVGSWELDVRHYWADVGARGLRGEAHFAWTLEGRAVQDVWIMPRPVERTPIRWLFTEITPDSFRWTGEELAPDGNSWKLDGEFLARRMR